MAPPARLTGGVLGLLTAAQLVTGCGRPPAAPPHQTVLRLAISRSGFTGQLAREYVRLLPDVTFQAVQSSENTLDNIINGDVDLGLTFADTSYVKNIEVQSQSNPRPALRAIGVLHVAPLHLLVRQGSGINALRDLRGRRVGTMQGDAIAERLLKALGLNGAIVKIGPIPRPELAGPGAESISSMLASNKLDALFIVNMYPGTVVEEAIKAGSRLLPIEGPAVTEIAVEYPFVHLISIPANTYPRQDTRIRTIGMPFLLVCRSDLDDDVGYRLAAHLLEAVSRVPLYNSVLRHIAVKDASATPIPLHDGAARYYREFEVLQ
jgi:TRAP transporter TAXI family solute receptor